jgi:hypothetical protein
MIDSLRTVMVCKRVFGFSAESKLEKQQVPGKALSERIQREYAVMETPGWRWILLVLLLGGQRLETSGIAILDSLFPR